MRGMRVTRCGAVLSLLAGLLFPFIAVASTALVPSPPTINADSYLLIDFDTGAVLVDITKHFMQKNYPMMQLVLRSS